MVDISIEILASSVELLGGHVSRYRVKTWWAHVDVPPGITLINLPRLPMIQQYLVMTGKDTTMFVETWLEDLRDSGIAKGPKENEYVALPQKRKFIGMTTCCVDEQLKNPNLNPSVQWLDVHDPIEDTRRGRLLLKVDARFAMPNASTNSRNVDLEQEVPVKVLLSPRFLAPSSYVDEDCSPTKHSTVSSRKSSTSVFSMGSIVSSRSQEQGIQTDLSLPVMSSLYRYSSPRESQCTSEEQTASRNGFRSPQNSKSLTRTPSVIDPLRYAEDILLRHSASNSYRKASAPWSGKPPIPTSSSLRKNCLIRQNQHQSMRLCDSNPTEEERRYSQDVDLEDVGDVIDILNNGVDSGLSPPSKITTGTKYQESQESEKRKSAFSRQNRTSSASSGHNSKVDTHDTNIRHAPEGRCVIPKGRSVPVSDHISPDSHKKPGPTNNNDSDHGLGVNRFKEVHFDGALAKQHATDILMTNNSATASGVPSPYKQIPRRRIAAAIFND